MGNPRPTDRIKTTDRTKPRKFCGINLKCIRWFLCLNIKDKYKDEYNIYKYKDEYNNYIKIYKDEYKDNNLIT